MKKIYRSINITESCYSKLKNYCDRHGLKIGRYVEILINESYGKGKENKQQAN